MFIDEHRDRFGVKAICEILEVSQSAYYQRATGLRSSRVIENELLLQIIVREFELNYCAYGTVECIIIYCGSVSKLDVIVSLV